MVAGRPKFLPCTPAGIIELLKRNDIEISGREAVIVGRSNIVGKPLANMLINESATVTVCHSKTRDLRNICQRADILIAAVGKAGLITSDMVKKNVTVIDVGMNRNEQGKLVGDVDFENVSKFTFAITPVPGGVGPMTVAMLMQNTTRAAKNL
jgi:methylenetetrahydrofolate dehydrogenase (NADP+)/methenyltetrahydrofolate cyclohydrolase